MVQMYWIYPFFPKGFLKIEWREQCPFFYNRTGDDMFSCLFFLESWPFVMHSDETNHKLNISTFHAGRILAYHEELDHTYCRCADSILTICPLCRYDDIYAIDKHNCRFEKRTEKKRIHNWDITVCVKTCLADLCLFYSLKWTRLMSTSWISYQRQLKCNIPRNRLHEQRNLERLSLFICLELRLTNRPQFSVVCELND